MLPRPAIVVVACLTIGPAVLAAQRPDSLADTVTSRRRRPLPPISVTGSLSSAPGIAIGISRSVMDAAGLRAEPTRNAVDALRRAPSVFIDEANGPLGPTIVRLRGGEETYTQIVMDGVPINENGGFFDAQGVTLTLVDRVEIARGPQSALYGSSAMSGVIQMHTRAGEPGPLRMDGTIEGSRTSAFGGGVRGTFGAMGGTERARYSLGVGSVYDRGQYRVPNHLEGRDAVLRSDFLPAESLVLSGVARYMDVDANLPVRDRGVTRAPLDPNQRQARTRGLGTIALHWAPRRAWTHQGSVSYFRRDFVYADQSDGLDQADYDSFVFDFNYHYEAVVRRAAVRYVTTATGQLANGVSGALSVGGEWLRESLTDFQRGDFGPGSMSVARPSRSAFGEAHARIRDRVTLLAGGRLERFAGLKSEFVPRATAVWDVVRERLSLRTALSRAYKAPNIQEQFPNSPAIVANPDLAPETSGSWEAGVDARLPMRGTASVVYFIQDFENLIRSVNYDTTGRQINRNLGHSRAAGVETEIALSPRPRWTIGGNMTWMRTRIIDNGGLPSSDFPNGATLPFRPSYTGTAWLDAPIARRGSVLIRMLAVGPQTVLANRFSGPRVDVAPYALLGATASWRLTSGTDSYVQIANILDRKYETAYDRPGMPRAFALGMRVRR
jgi:vitamin B12 transporter